MKNHGWRETGGDAPKWPSEVAEDIEVNVKAICYALDSCPDEYLQRVIIAVMNNGENTRWRNELRRNILLSLLSGN